MHETSFLTMKNFKDEFVPDGSSVLDIGSYNVNGTYTPIFIGCDYVGFDIRSGDNVDIVDWKLIENDSFDFVISGQTFEHVEDDLKLMGEIRRALKPGGVCCIIAPSTGSSQDYPSGYRRYQPEDMIKLSDSVGLEVVEAYLGEETMWTDCVLVARKPEEVRYDK
jgi:SAM-dependent methyltransferase